MKTCIEFITTECRGIIINLQILKHMLYCTINKVFCCITHIADTYVIINANGWEYKSSIDALIIL